MPVSVQRLGAGAWFGKLADGRVFFKKLAKSADVGLQASEVADFRPAFEHAARQEAQALLP
jgi:hypothetical protein